MRGPGGMNGERPKIPEGGIPKDGRPKLPEGEMPKVMERTQGERPELPPEGEMSRGMGRGGNFTNNNVELSVEFEIVNGGNYYSIVSR